MDWTNLFRLALGAALVNNFIMNRFLGICPFLGVSKKTETAAGMGIAVVFVIALSSAATYIVYHYLLVPLSVEYLYNIAFILVIAALVQFVEMFLKKSSPALYSALGVYLPLITTNCAVLGVTLINMQEGYDFISSVVNGVAAAAGFALVIIIFAGIRERVENCDIPEAFKGFPIALVTAGLMSIAFFGFGGLL